MASGEDQAIGAAIRRRREAAGVQQQTLAAAVGLAPGVMGRVELGTRACRASELRIIAKELGISTDELLRDVTPVSAAELVERAAFRRDVAYKSLNEYAEALAVAMREVSADEVTLDNGDTLTSPADVREHLAASQPPFDGVTVEKELVTDIRAALDALRASLTVRTRRTEQPDLSGMTMGDLEGVVSDE